MVPKPKPGERVGEGRGAGGLMYTWYRLISASRACLWLYADRCILSAIVILRNKRTLYDAKAYPQVIGNCAMASALAVLDKL